MHRATMVRTICLPGTRIASRIPVRKAIGGLLVVILAALWLANGYRTQMQVGPQDATAQAQLTAVVKPLPTPTP